MAFAAIFDMDGVMVDSNPPHKQALIDFCRQYGFELSEEQLRERIYGRTNRDWLTNLFGTLDEVTFRRYEQEKELRYQEIYRPYIQPLAGFVAFLEALTAAHIPKAIGTSAPPMNVDFTLQGIQLTPAHFEVIVNGNEVQRGKPDPEIYLTVAQRLGIAPQHCVVFEDSLSGIASAKAAGCKVIGVLSTHTAAELSDCDLCIEDFSRITVQDIKRLWL